ncbi:unnamed protein product [Prunus armeniaca]
MHSPGAVSLNAAKSPAIEVKSTITDLGQSHLSAVAIPNVLPTTFALTLNEGSCPMSMDFHPTWRTLLLLTSFYSSLVNPANVILQSEPGGVGDIGLWDVSSGKKLLSRNFRVWNLDAGPMALKVHLLLDYVLLSQPY